MHKIPILAAVFCALNLPAQAAGIQDHPAVSRYEGSTASRRDDDGFKTYTLVVGVNDRGKTDEELFKTLKVEGEVTRFAYENPKGRSAYEIFANYQQGLKQGGFEILFACQEKECGPGYASSGWGRVTGLRYASSDTHYLAAKSSKDGREIYVAVLVARLRHQLEIVETGQMQTGMVTKSC